MSIKTALILWAIGTIALFVWSEYIPTTNRDPLVGRIILSIIGAGGGTFCLAAAFAREEQDRKTIKAENGNEHHVIKEGEQNPEEQYSGYKVVGKRHEKIMHYPYGKGYSGSYATYPRLLLLYKEGHSVEIEVFELYYNTYNLGDIIK